MSLVSAVVVAGNDALAAEPNALREDILRHAADILTDTGAANAYVVTCDNQITALSAGQRVKFIAANSNAIASTLRFKNSLALDETKDLKKLDGKDLFYHDIVAGMLCEAIYDGTDFLLVSASNQLMNGLGNFNSDWLVLQVPSGVAGQSVISRYATTAGESVYTLDTLLTGASGFSDAPNAVSEAFLEGIMSVRYTSQTVGGIGLNSPGVSLASTSTRVTFTVDGASGHLYAVTGTGAGVTTTDLGAYTSEDLVKVRILYTQSACYFYIDNVLVATHTTNIPATITQFGVGSDELSATSATHGALLGAPILGLKFSDL